MASHPIQNEPGSCHAAEAGGGACHDPGAPRPAVAAGERTTCPMHPEVVQEGPGDCPICGMALEPMGVPASEDDGELRDMTRRFAVSVVFGLPVLVLTMAQMVPALSLPALPRPLEALLSTVVVLGCGAPFFRRGWASVRNGHPNMFTLIALGTGVAWLYSLTASFAPGVFPDAFREADGRVPVYFESAVVIIALVLLGQVLELRARAATGRALRALLELAPETACRVGPDGSEEIVPVGALVAGDRLRVRPGGRVPADGIVVEGHSAIDESMVSGEPIPVERGPGAEVIGGTLNGRGSLLLEVVHTGEETLLSRIVARVAEAQRSRAPLQAGADRVAEVFVPAVCAVAGLAFLAWAAFGPEPRLAHALVASVAVLVIACPCALGLATPMSVTVAMGRGAAAGVLFRNAEAIERLSEVDVLVLDKTGTLTLGRPVVTQIEPAEGAGLDADEALTLAAALERPSEHPLAGAVLRAAAERGLDVPPVEGFLSHPGQGVSGTVAGQGVGFGNASMLAGAGLDAGALAERAERLREAGAMVSFLVRGGRVAALLAVEDPVKPNAAESLAALRAANLRIVLLSGDAVTTVGAVADSLGIDEWHGGVLPEEKAAHLERLRSEGATVAMAGDGINDALALAVAHVGIAMGDGSDVALEAADVTLLRGDLAALARAFRLGRATVRNIRENLAFAFAYNTLGVPIAAGALYPFFGILLSPMLAAAAMSLSSVSVIGNALRLRAVRL